MKQVLLILSLSGLALCGSLSNEYLPANTGVSSNSAGGSFGPHSGGAVGTYSPSSRFASSGNAFGASSAPSPQYGAPFTQTARSQIGGQYFAPSQYSKPGSLYGAPSQTFGVSSLRSSTPFSSPSTQYGAPFRGSGASGFGPSTSFSSGSQYRAQPLPSTQYGAPSGFGQQYSTGVGSSPFQYSTGVGSSPFQYSSRIGQGRGISTQYGAPQQYQQLSQFGQPSTSFRAGPQFGGVSAHRPATPHSGTVQDANGAYIY